MSASHLTLVPAATPRPGGGKHDMLSSSTKYSWKKGEILESADIPKEISHLFDNPQHYHWNYPAKNPASTFRGFGFEIMKDVQISVSGHTVILSFDSDRCP
jgi:hypothetical protein